MFTLIVLFCVIIFLFKWLCWMVTCSKLWVWNGLPLNTYISVYAKGTDDIMNEVLEPITFVLAYPTLHGKTPSSIILKCNSGISS